MANNQAVILVRVRRCNNIFNTATISKTPPIYISSKYKIAMAYYSFDNLKICTNITLS